MQNEKKIIYAVDYIFFCILLLFAVRIFSIHGLFFSCARPSMEVFIKVLIPDAYDIIIMLMLSLVDSDRSSIMLLVIGWLF